MTLRALIGAIAFAGSPAFAAETELPLLPLAMLDISYRTEQLGEGTGAVIAEVRKRTNKPIVYDPVTRIAWAGNLLLGKAMLTLFAGHGGAEEFAATLFRLHQALDIKHVVPGHTLGRVENGDLVTDQLFYAMQVTEAARAANRAGLTADAMIERYPLSTFPRPHGVALWLNTLGRAHELNLRKTYQLMLTPE